MRQKLSCNELQLRQIENLFIKNKLQKFYEKQREKEKQTATILEMTRHDKHSAMLSQ